MAVEASGDRLGQLPGARRDKYHTLAEIRAEGLWRGVHHWPQAATTPACAGVERRVVSHLANIGDTRSLSFIRPRPRTSSIDAQKVQAGAGPDVGAALDRARDKDDIIADLEQGLTGK